MASFGVDSLISGLNAMELCNDQLLTETACYSNEYKPSEEEFRFDSATLQNPQLTRTQAVVTIMTRRLESMKNSPPVLSAFESARSIMLKLQFNPSLGHVCAEAARELSAQYPGWSITNYAEFSRFGNCTVAFGGISAIEKRWILNGQVASWPIEHK